MHAEKGAHVRNDVQMSKQMHVKRRTVCVICSGTSYQAWHGRLAYSGADAAGGGNAQPYQQGNGPSESAAVLEVVAKR